MVFLGTHAHRLDDKGRLAMPARFRPTLEGGLVICKGQERCLFVFPTAAFTTFTDELAAAPVTSVKVRTYSRTLFSSASNETPDGQGRITIPPLLRGYANLTKDCVVIGAHSRLEIWDAAAWQEWSERADAVYADIAEEVLPGSF